MKHISRRNFLKSSGVATAAAGLAACGADSSSAAASSSTASSSSEAGLPEGQILAEPTTFTIFCSLNGRNFDKDWAIFQEVGKKTNVFLEGTISSADSDVDAAWNRMLSSGKLPDIISYKNTAELEQLAFDGGIIPLNDLIKEHAPNIMAAFDRFDGFESNVKSLDGNIYQMPKVSEVNPQEFWWIRQDWLDAVGKEAPTTADEWYDVLKAFRDMDANGNGQADEVPLFDRAGWKLPDEYLWFWNSSTEFYPFDGKMVFEPMEPDFKTAVTNIVKWCEEKLVDPEIFTRGPTSRDVLLGNNTGGATHDWGSAGDYNNTLPETIPGFKMVAIAPPADQHGNVIERTKAVQGAAIGWAISSACKDPVAVIKYMDYWYAEEGINYMNYGIEGETYTVSADGTVSFTDKILKAEGTALGALQSYGCVYQTPGIELLSYRTGIAGKAAAEAMELYASHPEWYRADQPPYGDGRLKLRYSADVNDEYNSIMTPIRTYVDEKLQGWMLGISKFEDDYDEFIAELKERGIERATEINQIAYDAWLGN